MKKELRTKPNAQLAALAEVASDDGTEREWESPIVNYIFQLLLCLFSQLFS